MSESGRGTVVQRNGKVYKKLNFSSMHDNAETAGALIKAGTSSSPVSMSTADTKFIQLYLKSTATSGDNRAIYNRLFLAGAGSGGESLRAFTTVQAACGTAHGAHTSLNFSGDTTGELSGLGVAGRNTLHIPDDATWAGGTLAALQAEIYSDGAASDSDGLTELSFIRVLNDGHANGIADVDDDAFLMSLQGLTIGAGNVLAVKTSAAVSHTARVKIGAETYYLMLSDAQ